jgi:hypothetical protein
MKNEWQQYGATWCYCTLLRSIVYRAMTTTVVQPVVVGCRYVHRDSVVVHTALQGKDALPTYTKQVVDDTKKMKNCRRHFLSFCSLTRTVQLHSTVRWYLVFWYKQKRHHIITYFLSLYKDCMVPPPTTCQPTIRPTIHQWR